MEKELFIDFEKRGLLKNLTGTQVEKFRFACMKSVKENPDLSFAELRVACKIYLNFILDFPDLDLASVNSK